MDKRWTTRGYPQLSGKDISWSLICKIQNSRSGKDNLGEIETVNVVLTSICIMYLLIGTDTKVFWKNSPYLVSDLNRIPDIKRFGTRNSKSLKGQSDPPRAITTKIGKVIVLVNLQNFKNVRETIASVPYVLKSP